MQAQPRQVYDLFELSRQLHPDEQRYWIGRAGCDLIDLSGQVQQKFKRVLSHHIVRARDCLLRVTPAVPGFMIAWHDYGYEVSPVGDPPPRGMANFKALAASSCQRIHVGVDYQILLNHFPVEAFQQMYPFRNMAGDNWLPLALAYNAGPNVWVRTDTPYDPDEVLFEFDLVEIPHPNDTGHHEMVIHNEQYEELTGSLNFNHPVSGMLVHVEGVPQGCAPESIQLKLEYAAPMRQFAFQTLRLLKGVGSDVFYGADFKFPGINLSRVDICTLDYPPRGSSIRAKVKVFSNEILNYRNNQASLKYAG